MSDLVKRGLYYLFLKKIKGNDQLRGHRKAKFRLCFHRSSYKAAQIYKNKFLPEQ